MFGRFEVHVSTYDIDGHKTRLGKFNVWSWRRPKPEVVRDMIQARFAPRECELVGWKLFLLLPLPHRRPSYSDTRANAQWKWLLAHEIDRAKNPATMIWGSKAIKR